jgi:hypothetical protein
MIDPESRYRDTPTAEHLSPTGRRIVHLRRRFIPSATALVPIARAVVTEGDRLDLVAGRAIGDPLQWWQVADANDAMNPAELEQPAGRILDIAVVER